MPAHDDKLFSIDLAQQWRDADHNGLIGARGFLNLFQDSSSYLLHNIGKGNDTLLAEYGINWVYTKYRLHVHEQSGFEAPMHFESWMEPSKSSAIFNCGFEASRDGRLYAEGRLEMCLFDVGRQRLVRPRSIDMPDLAIDRTTGTGPFRKLRPDPEAMERRLAHKVMYTDLDNSRHMTNLNYAKLFLDAFDGEYHERMIARDLEIHFTGQCFEGDEIVVYRREEAGGAWLLLAEKADGAEAAVGFLEFEERGGS